MTNKPPLTYLFLLATVLSVMWVSGCKSIMASATGGLADNLSSAILNQDDPETVRDGAPAYLLLMDSFIEGDPKNSAMLKSAANLYAAYGAVFVEDEERSRRLTRRAFDYGKRAICVEHSPACTWNDLEFETYTQELEAVREKRISSLYSYAVSWLVFTRAHADDWKVMADLPRAEVTLNRVFELDPGYQGGNVHLYLGILNTLRPPALGGKPEVAKIHFEQAIELSDGKNLGAKVEFARSYARLLYDRELHDRLLAEVLDAEPVAPGFTLLNTLAQREAQELLESADDYF
ncbi:MAG: TRAP transporter TatT component family protein [Gammaproteobacteria bacterium]|nr:TRAP transporter TatT component family protein [Gammaproteobacteria bacterium]